MKAEYKCMKCHYTWQTKPDPVDCPKCGHFYIKWINYVKLKTKSFKS